MSRKATNAYIGTKRRAYAQANRARRSRILDEVCETTGYERKYANRLLTGNRKFRERKGRGKTYGDDVAEVHSTGGVCAYAACRLDCRSKARHDMFSYLAISSIAL